MRLQTRYAVYFKGIVRFWVQFHPDTFFGVTRWKPDSFATSNTFTPACMVDERTAKAFLKKPGIDPRYKLMKIEINAVEV